MVAEYGTSGSHHCDVIVVGGGHAGCEAALAAARTGCSVAMVTLSREAIGRLSCNPAIGGLAKGHLVREIDALGGSMGRLADLCGIQFRLLNRSRGPAVRGPRAQIDHRSYRRAMLQEILSCPNLELVEGEAAGLMVADGAVTGVALAGGESITAGKVVLTTGTFLRGMLHTGAESTPGGRLGEPPAEDLSRSLASLGLRVDRFKTGTPPRLERESVDLSRFEQQPGDPRPVFFSECTESTRLPQISCHIAATNPAVHRIVRENLDRCPLYNGTIRTRGPRYCPSFEAKVVEFSDRPHHTLFIEPEGLESELLYLNGLSTSLPREVQEELVRAVEGLEEARIARPGYAVEYDYVDPTELLPTLETRKIRGLFLAGQINGTTGYEEAAALGLVAGLNASLAVRDEEPLVLGRAESYIGVLVDDLVTRGTSEPYRMFTSRAEYRLLLGIDTASRRLAGHGLRTGLLDRERARRSEERWRRLEAAVESLERERWLPDRPTRERLLQCGVRLEMPSSTADLLRRPEADPDLLAPLSSRLSGLDREDRRVAAETIRYSGYVERQQREAERVARAGARKIPGGFVFKGLAGLSNELAEKLEAVRPETLGRASRVDGMTPAALALLAAHLERR
jgi:tRNA uridine 5-carboxymethylaminomethyl modification enzyme